jgi:hypothetical protein
MDLQSKGMRILVFGAGEDGLRVICDCAVQDERSHKKLKTSTGLMLIVAFVQFLSRTVFAIQSHFSVTL